MNRLHVALVGDAAHDPDLRVQPAAVNRQINIDRIVVRGEEHGGCLMDAGAFDDAPVGRVSHEDGCRPIPHLLQGLGAPVERVHRDALPGQGGGCCLADLPRPDHQHRAGRAVVALEQTVERRNLGGVASHDQHAIRLDDRLGVGRLQLSPLPQPDHAEPRSLAQACVAHRQSRKRRIAGWQLRNLKRAV